MVALEKQNVRFGNPGVRDFLQRVVVDDGQLLPIVERLESFDEVSAAWEIWSAQGLGPTPLTQRVWTTAARAMMEYNTGSDLDHLALLMDLQGGMAEADAAALINQALDVLESTEIEPDEWEQLQSMIFKPKTVNEIKLIISAEDELELAVRVLHTAFGLDDQSAAA